MAINYEDLDKIFAYHQFNEEQIRNSTNIRSAARNFALVILQNTKPSPDQTTAIRKIREAVMTANASIALDGKF